MTRNIFNSLRYVGRGRRRTDVLTRGSEERLTAERKIYFYGTFYRINAC